MSAFDALFSGQHPGLRAVHSNGILCEGTFEASPEAQRLSLAPHFGPGIVPVLVRFSNFSGVPGSADGDPAGSPRGMSIKFLLADGGETDIVAHSYNGFPAGTPEDFLEFLRSLGSGDPARVARFADAHSAAKAFLQDPKPAPVSYATEQFFGVDAFRFTNAWGESRYGRYVIVPDAGPAHLAVSEAAARSATYLRDEMTMRLAAAPVRFRLSVQIAEPQDVVTDGSRPWPADRTVVDAGTITLTVPVERSEIRQRRLLFTPLNLVGGIAPSDDPLLVARSRAYRISFDRRARVAEAVAAEPVENTSP